MDWEKITLSLIDHASPIMLACAGLIAAVGTFVTMLWNLYKTYQNAALLKENTAITKENTAITQEGNKALGKRIATEMQPVKDALVAAKELKNMQQDQIVLWRGIIGRGFLEAEKAGHLTKMGEAYAASSIARNVYGAVAERLKSLFRELRTSLGKEPGHDEFSWIVEKSDMQGWIIDHVCPILGVHQHGCLAIASVIARENETLVATPPS